MKIRELLFYKKELIAEFIIQFLYCLTNRKLKSIWLDCIHHLLVFNFHIYTLDFKDLI